MKKQLPVPVKSDILDGAEFFDSRATNHPTPAAISQQEMKNITISIIIHAYCDYDNCTIYMLVPENFTEEHRFADRAMIYVLEKPNGFQALTPVVEMTSIIKM